MPGITTASIPQRRPRKKARLPAGGAEAGPATPSTSRNAASKKQLRGRRGGLKDMPNMPIDILLEVRDASLLASATACVGRRKSSCYVRSAASSQRSLIRPFASVTSPPVCPCALSTVCLPTPLLTAASAQIFSHLLPIDLLNLARTSKSFRTLLMSRSSRTLWRVSRQLVDGLPECPEHLSEPAYANLVFSNHCHVRSVPACVYATRL